MSIVAQIVRWRRGLPPGRPREHHVYTVDRHEAQQLLLELAKSGELALRGDEQMQAGHLRFAAENNPALVEGLNVAGVQLAYYDARKAPTVHGFEVHLGAQRKKKRA